MKTRTSSKRSTLCSETTCSKLVSNSSTKSRTGESVQKNYDEKKALSCCGCSGSEACSTSTTPSINLLVTHSNGKLPLTALVQCRRPRIQWVQSSARSNRHVLSKTHRNNADATTKTTENMCILYNSYCTRSWVRCDTRMMPSRARAIRARARVVHSHFVEPFKVVPRVFPIQNLKRRPLDLLCTCTCTGVVWMLLILPFQWFYILLYYIIIDCSTWVSVLWFTCLHWLWLGLRNPEQCWREWMKAGFSNQMVESLQLFAVK